MIASKYVVVLKTNVDVFLHRDTVYFVNIFVNQLLPSQKFRAFKNALTVDVGGLEVQHSSGFNGDIQSRHKKAFLVTDGLFAKAFLRRHSENDDKDHNTSKCIE